MLLLPPHSPGPAAQILCGAYVGSDSPYLEVDEPEKRPEFAKQIFGAAGLYLGTMLLSIFFWVRAVRA